MAQTLISSTLSGKVVYSDSAFEPPEYLTESVNLSWGKPNSIERLQKMRNSLNTSLGMQLGKSNPSQQAIDKWTKDIDFLDTVLQNKLN